MAAMTSNPPAAAPTPIPAFAPVESPAGAEVAEVVTGGVGVDKVGVVVTGPPAHRARSVFCHAI